METRSQGRLRAPQQRTPEEHSGEEAGLSQLPRNGYEGVAVSWGHQLGGSTDRASCGAGGTQSRSPQVLWAEQGLRALRTPP